MTTQKIIYLLIGITLGFVVGFAFANGVNRREQDTLRAEVTRLRAGAKDGETLTGTAGASSNSRTTNADEDSIPNLSEEQLRNAIAKADASPDDASLQRISGQGLYLYAMKSGNTSILPDAARILKRAHEANPKDYQITVLAGNALFLVGRERGDSAPLDEARGYYQKALLSKPDDVIVRTSLGLTYFYDKPSDPQRAIAEYRKSLMISPRHEATLQNLVTALVANGNLPEAEKRLAELEKVNASNTELPNLRAQLEQKKNAARESK
ncbi:MAG: tetratricopeptide repeat protein [Acidobacteria bacterium]|nr:tetratricopeptide repeat protein [Acidobacteriota bacterium]